MSYALARGTRWEPAPRDHEEWHRARDQVVHDFELVYGRQPIGPQADGITAVRRWYHGAIAVEKRNGQTGRRIHRPWGQMFRGVANDLDWELGPTYAENCKRYRNQVARRLDHLVAMGDIERWEPVYDARGESTGILIHVPAGVAQSVQPSLRFRRSRRPGGTSSSARQLARRGLASHGRLDRPRELSNPSGNCGAGGVPSVVNPPRGTSACVSARGGVGSASVDAIERACTPTLRPALRRLRTALREADRPRRVLADACRAGESPVVVALACWELATDGQREPRLSLDWRGQLERSAEQLDRLRGPGEAALWLAQRIDGLGNDELIDGRPVRSLAYYAHALKQVARAGRRRARGAGKPRAWKSRRPEASSW